MSLTVRGKTKHWPNLRHDDAACGAFGTWRIPTGAMASSKARITCSRCRRLVGADDGVDKQTSVRRPRRLFVNCQSRAMRDNPDRFTLARRLDDARAENRRLRAKVKALEGLCYGNVPTVLLGSLPLRVSRR